VIFFAREFAKHKATNYRSGRLSRLARYVTRREAVAVAAAAAAQNRASGARLKEET